MTKVFLTILIVSAVATSTKAAIYIPIGSNCVTAIHIKDHQLRFASYPFDWLMASFSGIYAAIDEDFARFFTALKLNKNGSGVIDAYGLEFIHDWRIATHLDVNLETVDWVPNNTIAGDWQEMVPEIVTKYQRRIDRFRSVCNSDEKVFFIRSGSMTQAESILLRDLIIKKYPHLDFTLVVVAQDAGFESPWNLNKIKNFYIGHSDGARWNAMLDQLNIEANAN